MKIATKIQILLGLIIVILLVVGISVFLMEKRIIEVSGKIDDLKILNELRSPIELPRKAVEVKPIELTANITGYNSIESQTDSSPCYAGNEYICGRDDVVACPRSIPKGTWVKIGGRMYECVDRLALKYDNRFDIFCDKDLGCPYEVSGHKKVIVYLIN